MQGRIAQIAQVMQMKGPESTRGRQLLRPASQLRQYWSETAWAANAGEELEIDLTHSRDRDLQLSTQQKRTQLKVCLEVWSAIWRKAGVHWRSRVALTPGG